MPKPPFTAAQIERMYQISEEWREEVADLLIMLEEMGTDASLAFLLNPTARADQALVSKLSFVERKIQALLKMRSLPHRA